MDKGQNIDRTPLKVRRRSNSSEPILSTYHKSFKHLTTTLITVMINHTVLELLLFRRISILKQPSDDRTYGKDVLCWFRHKVMSRSARTPEMTVSVPAVYAQDVMHCELRDCKMVVANPSVRESSSLTSYRLY